MNRPASLLSKPEAVKWLADHGLGVSGTRKELIDRVRLYQRSPNLVKKLRRRYLFNRSFPCSLNQTSIPPLTAPWKAGDNLLPVVTRLMFANYAAQKREGSLGQQSKAVRMLQSRKIVSVKTLVDGTNTYVRAMVKNSYGCETRPAVILFANSLPQKAYCRCTVGSSGICCHVLALLLFLQHFAESGEKLLELTVTQQLQTWHKKGRKGSIPMVPLTQIKIKSAKLRKGKNGIAISAADPDKSTFKRNVPELIKQIEKNLEKAKPVTEHFYSVLSKSEIGRKSSFGEHICFKYKMNKLEHHDYLSEETFDENLLGIVDGKMKRIDGIIFQKTSETYVPDTSQVTVESSLNQGDLDLDIENSTRGIYENDDCVKMQEEIKKHLNENCSSVKIDLSFLEAPTPTGSKYINCVQKSPNWHIARKHKITGSRIPALLGLYGNNRFEKYWDIVRHGTEDEGLF